MPILLLRPLLTAIVEYLLAFRVFRKGHILPIATTLFLICLATYQFAEFFFLSTENRAWLAISLFATTMLPPYGLLLVEKLSHRKTFYLLFFIASFGLALSFFFFPTVIPGASECNCFAKFDRSVLTGWNAIFFTTWGWYYFLSLALTMLLISWHILKKNGDTKNLFLLFLGYSFFFPSAYFLIFIWNLNLQLISSVMCALAIFTAFVVTHISTENLAPDYKRQKKKRLLNKNKFTP